MHLLSYIGLFIPFLPALIASVRWTVLPKEVRWFTIMLWAIGLNGVLGLWAETQWTNNLPFFHSYILIEALFLIKVFSFLLPPIISKRNLLIVGAIFTLFWIGNVLFFDGIWANPAYIRLAETVIMLTLATVWFYKVMKEQKHLSLTRLFSFWLSTAVLIFYSGNLLLYVFNNFVFYQARHVFVVIWGIHAFVSIITYLIYTIAIIWALKNPISS